MSCVQYVLSFDPIVITTQGESSMLALVSDCQIMQRITVAIILLNFD